MEVPVCKCFAIFDGETSTQSSFEGVELCPLHRAASEMWLHATELIKGVMDSHLDSERASHLQELKKVLEGAAK